MLPNILLGISAVILALVLVVFFIAVCLWIASRIAADRHEQRHKRDKIWPQFKEDKDE